jgi:hypothetical protein
LSEFGVTELERELSIQLEAAQRLTDWYREQRQQSAESVRNILLLLIGLFGVFSVASYLSLANGSTEKRYTGIFRFMNSSPNTEVYIVLGVFALFLIAGVWLLWRQIRDTIADWRVRRSQEGTRRPSGRSGLST